MALEKGEIKQILAFTQGVMSRSKVSPAEAEKKLQGVADVLSAKPDPEGGDNQTQELEGLLGSGLDDLSQGQGLQL